MRKNITVIIEIILGISFLILVTASELQDLTQGDFDNGTYFQTEYNSSGFIQLSLGNLSGNFTSQIFHTGMSRFDNLSWTSAGVDNLPDNQRIETIIFGVNMTGNVLLSHMDGDWQDFSGNGNNGTSIGGANFISSSKIGNYAGNFDGGEDYVSYGNDSSLGISDSITISAWIKPNDVGTNLIEKENIDWTVASNWNSNLNMIWNNTVNALQFIGKKNTYLTKRIPVDTTKGYYLEYDFTVSSDLNHVSYSGSHSYTTLTSSWLPGHPGSYDYFVDSGSKYDNWVWLHRKNNQIGGIPRTGESTTVSDRTVWHNGTRYMTVMFLTNYATGSIQSSYLKNLRFYEDETGISKRDSYELAFSNDSFSGKINKNRIKSALNNDKWNHVVMTYDRNLGSNQQRLYLNGVLVNQSTLTESINITADNLTIYLNGSIDEVSIWNRSLSATEILNIYRRGISNLDFTVRSCNDLNCNGENWQDINNSSPQNLFLDNNTYFQYKVNFSTENESYTPILFNVTMGYFLMDIEFPSVNLTLPEEGFNTSSQIIVFNFTAADDYPADLSCSLYIDNHLNITNSTIQHNILTNFQVSGIEGGLHYWNISCSDISEKQNWSNTRSFYVDIYSPIVSNIVYSPNLTDYIDPGTNITFNATIVDDRMDVNKVILQYHNGSAWANKTMINISENVYSTSIVTIGIDSNYTFNIWANDSFGNANQTVNQTFNSTWDCTWQATSDLSSTAGWAENKWVGNITINNTGDVEYSDNNCSLSFHLVHDLIAGRIYFNDWNLNSVYNYYDVSSVSAKSNQTIQINATFLSEVKQEELIITTAESYSRSNTPQRNTTVTIVSNQAGPYLYQAITSNPSSVYLTPGNMTLQAYLRNLMGNSVVNENNTAYNVSFNWTFASGLTNVSGNLSREFVNITDSNLHYNNLIISFSSLASMTSGVKTIYLYSWGYNLSGDLIVDASGNTLLTEQANITFLCYNVSDGVCVSSCGYTQDSDCEESVVITYSDSSGGGGGGGAAKDKFEQSSAYFELLRGEAQEFQLSIENAWNSVKKNILISVSGIKSEYISISPALIQQIDPKSSKNITIRITAPAYFTKGEYKLTFLIKGQFYSNNTKEDFSEKKVVTLYIVEVLREDADDMINQSMKMISGMNESGMVLEDVSLFFEEILLNYELVNFLEVQKGFEQINKIYNAAFKSLEILEELKTSITDAELRGITVLETKKMLYIAEAAFGRGAYFLALKNLEEAKMTFALETKGEFNLLYTIKNNPFETVLALMGICIFSFSSSLVVRYRLYKRKLKLLGEEEKLLLELMKVVQRETFENNKMSMEEYGEAMKQYEEKLSKTIEDRIKVQTKMVNLLKIKGKNKALKQEKERLIELVKDLQDKYLNKSQIESRVYENMLKSYTTKISDVEGQLTFLEARQAFKGKGIFKKNPNKKLRKREEKEKKKEEKIKQKVNKLLKQKGLYGKGVKNEK